MQKLKVGQKVRLKSGEWIKKTQYKPRLKILTGNMQKDLGELVTIISISTDTIRVDGKYATGFNYDIELASPISCICREEK